MSLQTECKADYSQIWLLTPPGESTCQWGLSQKFLLSKCASSGDTIMRSTCFVKVNAGILNATDQNCKISNPRPSKSRLPAAFRCSCSPSPALLLFRLPALLLLPHSLLSSRNGRVGEHKPAPKTTPSHNRWVRTRAKRLCEDARAVQYLEPKWLR